MELRFTRLLPLQNIMTCSATDIVKRNLILQTVNHEGATPHISCILA
jgi:hypothetical protein